MRERHTDAYPWGSAVLLGAWHGWSMATPWDGKAWWGLQLLALVLFLQLLQRQSAQASPKIVRLWLLETWLFGTVWFASSMSWLYTSMHTYGGLHPMLAIVGVVALSALLGIFYATALCAYAFWDKWMRKAGKTTSRVWRVCMMSAVWLLAELARGQVMTGLPWSAIGYAHVDSVFAVAAPHVGVYGMAALVVACAMSLVQVYERSTSRQNTVWWTVLWCFMLFASYPSVSITAQKANQLDNHKAVSVTLLQGNIAQNEKFDQILGVEPALAWYQKALLEAKTDMVIAPETAVPVLPQQLPQNYWDMLQSHFDTKPTTKALFGIPLGNEADGYSNSVVGFDRNAANGLYRYDKHHLVPFGEFIPPFFKWFTRMMNIPLGDFNRGALGQASYVHANERWAPLICYEDLFGEELAVRFMDLESAPTVFVNLSNLGWFGSGAVIDQHLNISRMRALEFDRPVVRATNTGSTAIINHKGQVTHELPRATQGVLVGEVVGRSTLTPYAWWVSQWGLTPLWLLGLLVVVLGVRLAMGQPQAK